MKRKTSWKNYCTVYDPKCKEALDAMRRLSQYHREVVKRAIQKQKVL